MQCLNTTLKETDTYSGSEDRLRDHGNKKRKKIGYSSVC